MKAWTRPSKSFLISFGFFTSLAIAAGLDGSYYIAGILGLLSLIFLTEYIWDTSIAVYHFVKCLNITSEKWNRVETNVVIPETSRAVEENVLQGAEKTILRFRKHALLHEEEEKEGLEMAASSN
jgi:hypothetical protein